MLLSVMSSRDVRWVRQVVCGEQTDDTGSGGPGGEAAGREGSDYMSV